RQGINDLPFAVAGGVRDALWGAASLVGRAVRNPMSAVAGAVGYARSSARVMSRAAEPSPLLQRRSLATRTEAIDIPLSDLHRAAKAGGGSINDAYLAGLCGALGRYHEVLGVPVATLPMAVPVNLRAEADPAGGNRFTGVNLAAPVGTADPVERMRKIRAQMTQRREEPAMDVIGSVAPLMSVLPTPLLEAMTGSVIASDVQASNVPVYPGDTYLAGAKILRQYGIGPLPGVAMMVVLISRGGYCTITVRYDRAAVRHEEFFARCLLEGFDEILAMGGEPTPHAVPASFGGQPPDSSARSVSGS
ncbi:MAG: WS/DGAT domain-containing protein, partial [Mycobacterium sp.]